MIASEGFPGRTVVSLTRRGSKSWVVQNRKCEIPWKGAKTSHASESLETRRRWLTRHRGRAAQLTPFPRSYYGLPASCQDVPVSSLGEMKEGATNRQPAFAEFRRWKAPHNGYAAAPLQRQWQPAKPLWAWRGLPVAGEAPLPGTFLSAATWNDGTPEQDGKEGRTNSSVSFHESKHVRLPGCLLQDQLDHNIHPILRIRSHSRLEATAPHLGLFITDGARLLQPIQ